MYVKKVYIYLPIRSWMIFFLVVTFAETQNEVNFKTITITTKGSVFQVKHFCVCNVKHNKHFNFRSIILLCKVPFWCLYLGTHGRGCRLFLKIILIPTQYTYVFSRISSLGSGRNAGTLFSISIFVCYAL